MTNIPFPMLTAPGQAPQAGGGRLINCFPEPLAATAGKPNAYWRVPGLNAWGTAPTGLYRGGIVVSGVFYALFGSTIYTFSPIGGAGTPLTGTIPGSAYCWFAANQNAPPDIVCVSPGLGAFIVGSSSISNYPGTVIGTPNSVVFMFGMFIFTYGNGLTQASDQNSTNINALNFANAQSKSDTLYRPVPLGNGQLLLCGSSTIEVWGNTNPTGYPFSYISTIFRGIAGPQAIAGNEDGWGKGIFFVGDDNKVSTLTTYTPTPISVPDLDVMIEAEPDKTRIIVGVYVSRGHGFVLVQSPTWCWEYDTTLQTWHERRSYLQRYWRGYQPIYVFGDTGAGMWLCGDVKSSSMLKIDSTIRTEGGTNDVQTMSITRSVPTGGSFRLVFGGITSSPINWNASANDVLTALSSIVALSGNIQCEGGPLPNNPVTITFINVLGKAPQAVLTVGVNNLTGGSAPPNNPLPAVAHTKTGALPDPLRMRIETGPMGAFPKSVRVNTIELYLTEGQSNALGHPPDETNAMIDVSISRNGGQVWSNPRSITIGRQAVTDGRVRASVWGQVDTQGVRWRFEESAGINFGFMGADMIVDVLG